MELSEGFAALLAGRARKQPASAAGLVDRRYDHVLKGIDAEDDAEDRKTCQVAEENVPHGPE